MINVELELKVFVCIRVDGTTLDQHTLCIALLRSQRDLHSTSQVLARTPYRLIHQSMHAITTT